MSTLKSTFLLEDKYTSNLRKIINNTQKFYTLINTVNKATKIDFSAKESINQIDQFIKKISQLEQKTLKLNRLHYYRFKKPTEKSPFIQEQIKERLNHKTLRTSKQPSDEISLQEKPLNKTPLIDKPVRQTPVLEAPQTPVKVNLFHKLYSQTISSMNRFISRLTPLSSNLFSNVFNKVKSHLDQLKNQLKLRIDKLTSNLHLKGLDQLKTQLKLKLDKLTSNLHLKGLEKLKTQLKVKLDKLTSNMNLKGFDQLKNQLSSKISKLSENLSQKLRIPSFQKESNEILDLVKSISALGIAVMGVKKAFNIVKESVMLRDQQNSQRLSLQAVYGDELGKNVYNYARERAKSSPLGQEEIIKSLSFSAPFIQNEKDLNKYISLMERLYARDPSQDVGFPLKEALSGEIESLKGRFGISLSGEKLRSLDNSEKLNYIEQEFNKFGINDTLVEKQTETLTVKLNMFTSNLKTKFAESTGVISEKITLVVDKLNEMLNTGKLDSFINLMMNGFNGLLNIIFKTTNAFSSLFQFIKQNSFAQALLFTFISLLAINGIGLFSKLIGIIGMLTVKMLSFIITLSLSHPLLTGLIGGFLLLSAIFEEGKGILNGMVVVVFSIIRAFNALWIMIQMVYNGILTIIEGIVNEFIKMRNNLIEIFKGIVNGCFNVLKPLTKMLDNIFGSNLTDSLNRLKQLTTGTIEQLKIEPDFNLNKMKAVYKDFSTPLETKVRGFLESDEKNKKLLNPTTDTKIDLSGFNDLNKGFENLEKDGLGVKNMNGALNVSIDKEDLKYLKDIAERDVVKKVSQNTLNPTITVNFGDIHETADVYKIQKVVEKALIDELAVIGNL